MAEVIAVIMAALLASALAHYIKGWLRPMAARADLPRWPRRLVVAAMVVAPAFMGVVLILGLHAAFEYFGLPYGVIDFAFKLATVLVLVRFGVHAISVSLGPNSWM